MDTEKTTTNVTEIKKKAKFSFKENLQKITIVLISAIYITQGIFQISKKDASIWDILGSIGLSIVVGIIISTSMNSMGLKDGRKSDLFKGSMKIYGETKEKATQYFNKLEDWCNYKHSKEIESKKREIIQNAGLKWKLYIIRYYDDNKPTEKDKIQALYDADHCKVEALTSKDLMSDLPSPKYMKRRFGRGVNEYNAVTNTGDAFFKVVIGVVSGMYMLYPLLDSDTWASVLWNALQIAMWLTFSVMKYADAKSFMEDEYRQTHIILKTEYLNEFIVTMQKDPSVVGGYDEDEEARRYIESLKKKEETANERVQENPVNGNGTDGSRQDEPTEHRAEVIQR